VLEKFPAVMGLALENMAAHVDFLKNRLGVSEAKLGQVRDCALHVYDCMTG
jgi:hypothetical protein